MIEQALRFLARLTGRQTRQTPATPSKEAIVVDVNTTQVGIAASCPVELVSSGCQVLKSAPAHDIIPVTAESASALVAPEEVTVTMMDVVGSGIEQVEVEMNPLLEDIPLPILSISTIDTSLHWNFGWFGPLQHDIDTPNPPKAIHKTPSTDTTATVDSGSDTLSVQSQSEKELKFVSSGSETDVESGWEHARADVYGKTARFPYVEDMVDHVVRTQIKEHGGVLKEFSTVHEAIDQLQLSDLALTKRLWDSLKYLQLVSLVVSEFADEMLAAQGMEAKSFVMYHALDDILDGLVGHMAAGGSDAFAMDPSVRLGMLSLMDAHRAMVNGIPELLSNLSGFLEWLGWERLGKALGKRLPDMETSLLAGGIRRVLRGEPESGVRLMRDVPQELQTFWCYHAKDLGDYLALRVEATEPEPEPELKLKPKGFRKLWKAIKKPFKRSKPAAN